MRNVNSAAATCLLAAFFSVMFLLPARQASAQKLMEKGSTALGLGLGLGYSYYSSASGYSTPWLFRAHLDHGIAELGVTTVSLGPMIGFGRTVRRWNYSRNYELVQSWTNIIVAARGAIHYDFETPRLDTYVGLALGPRIESYRERWSNDKDPGYENRESYGGAYMAGAFFLGAAYGLTDKISLFGEFGFGYSWANIGLQFHF